VLTLEVRSQAGETVFRTTTELSLRRDTTTQLVFDVPSLALLGGDYDLSLSAAAAGPAGAPLDRTTRFSVAHEPGAEGVVDLRGSWRELETVQPAR
jgi:hypothetical protein